MTITSETDLTKIPELRVGRKATVCNKSYPKWDGTWEILEVRAYSISVLHPKFGRGAFAWFEITPVPFTKLEKALL